MGLPPLDETPVLMHALVGAQRRQTQLVRSFQT